MNPLDEFRMAEKAVLEANTLLMATLIEATTRRTEAFSALKMALHRVQEELSDAASIASFKTHLAELMNVLRLHKENVKTLLADS